jgi:D-alanine-D-alanine ligase
VTKSKARRPKIKKMRLLVLVHSDLVPPDSLEGYSDKEILEWRTEYDVVSTLRSMGHEVHALGVSDDLGAVRKEIDQLKPHVASTCSKNFTASRSTISTWSVI